MPMLYFQKDYFGNQQISNNAEKSIHYDSYYQAAAFLKLLICPTFLEMLEIEEY